MVGAVTSWDSGLYPEVLTTLSSNAPWGFGGAPEDEAWAGSSPSPRCTSPDPRAAGRSQAGEQMEKMDGKRALVRSCAGLGLHR